MGSIPGSERSPGEGNGNLLQYSPLGNLMDRGAWQATVHWVAMLSLATEHSTQPFHQQEGRKTLLKMGEWPSHGEARLFLSQAGHDQGHGGFPAQISRNRSVSPLWHLTSLLPVPWTYPTNKAESISTDGVRFSLT